MESPQTRLLLPQQQEALDATVEALSSHDRAKVLMACGSGKTRIGPAIAIERAARSVIVFLPSLALVRQTLPEWRDVVSDLSFLCVCSDNSVIPDSDEPVVTEADLGCAVTTESAMVRDFLTIQRGTCNGRPLFVFDFERARKLSYQWRGSRRGRALTAWLKYDNNVRTKRGSWDVEVIEVV